MVMFVGAYKTLLEALQVGQDQIHDLLTSSRFIKNALGEEEHLVEEALAKHEWLFWLIEGRAHTIHRLLRRAGIINRRSIIVFPGHSGAGQPPPSSAMRAVVDTPPPEKRVTFVDAVVPTPKDSPAVPDFTASVMQSCRSEGTPGLAGAAALQQQLLANMASAKPTSQSTHLIESPDVEFVKAVPQAPSGNVTAGPPRPSIAESNPGWILLPHLKEEAVPANPSKDPYPGNTFAGKLIWQWLASEGITCSPAKYELPDVRLQGNSATKQAIQALPSHLSSPTKAEELLLLFVRRVLAATSEKVAQEEVIHEATLLITFLVAIRGRIAGLPSGANRERSNEFSRAWRDLAVHILLALLYYAKSGMAVYLWTLDVQGFADVVQRATNQQPICFSSGCGDLGHVSTSCPRKDKADKKDTDKGYGKATGNGSASSTGGGKSRWQRSPSRSPPRSRKDRHRDYSPGSKRDGRKRAR